MNQQDVVDKMLKAKTAEEVRDARNAAKAWLHMHPDDITVRLAGSSLARVARVLGVKE